MKKFCKIFYFLMMIMLFMVSSVYSANELIIAQTSDAKTLDPAASNDVYSHNITLNIYDRLFDWTPQMELEMNLAESYSQIDSLTLQVKIKKDIKFHNGDELTAEDVKFSLERASKAPMMMTYFSDIEKVDILDPYTVNIITKKPYGPLLTALAHSGGSILSKKYIESVGDKAYFEPIGTGPFKFGSWKAGDKIILYANKEYFRGIPGTDALIFRVIPESTNRVIALETREVDIVTVVDPVDVPMVNAKDYLRLYNMPSVASTYMGFNCDRGPTSDIRVRQAIVAALNLQDIVDNAFFKLSDPAYSMVAPATIGYNDKITAPVRDIEKAKKLLTDAGYKDGLKIKLWTNENQSRKDAAVIMQEQLKDVGIEVTIEVLEWSAYLANLNKGEHDLYLLGAQGAIDPDGAMYSYHSKYKGSGGNKSFYGNKRVDELLDKGRETIEIEKRIPYYKEAQEIIIKEVGVFPLAYSPSLVGVPDYIEGFEVYPAFEYFFRKVKKNKK
jgi:peptide/nickel transport system substrate-binding protein